MSVAETRPILIENDAGATRPGALHVVRYSDRDRMGGALKALGSMWALALVTVFIPLAHFVLVPGFLIAGPVMAVMRYRVTEKMESATGECPTCGQDMTVQLEPTARLPLWAYCSPASDPIRLRESHGPAAVNAGSG